MGVSHATSGAFVGLALASAAPALAGVHSREDALVFAVLTAGFSLLPDLDHPTSTATRRFGPASWLASRVVRPLSAAVFRATAGPGDHGEGTHRALTHTGAAAVALGVGVNAAVAVWGSWALWSVVFVGLALAVKGIDHLIPGPPSLAAAGLLTAGLWWTVGAGHAWAGTAVAVGMLVHDVGDALTESGAPLLWPLSIRGRRWYPVGLPRPLRFHTGGVVEVVLLAGMTAAALWLGAGLWPWLAEVRDSAAAAVGGRL
jgi:membrane-bound metal-dependent hydrolase YbcI (DUF457 family)